MGWVINGVVLTTEAVSTMPFTLPQKLRSTSQTTRNRRTNQASQALRNTSGMLDRRPSSGKNKKTQSQQSYLTSHQRTLARKDTNLARSESSSSGSSPASPSASLALPSARSGADAQRCCIIVNIGRTPPPPLPPPSPTPSRPTRTLTPAVDATPLPLSEEQSASVEAGDALGASPPGAATATASPPCPSAAAVVASPPVWRSCSPWMGVPPPTHPRLVLGSVSGLPPLGSGAAAVWVFRRAAAMALAISTARR